MDQKISLPKWQAYIRLMRFDKPIGTLLLLWPTLWALWSAQKGIPSPYILLVFILGVVLMRAAGCVINDFADRRVDGFVERTKSRPLPLGEISEREAKTLFIVLIIIAFLLVLTLNYLTITLSLVALLLAWVYPFMKRITYLPQFVLGMAFGWAIPMGYAAVTNSLPLACWVIFLANIFWTVAYDTLYAMVDREDDLKIGVKSTAILFGRYDQAIIILLQLLTLVSLVCFGVLNHFGYIYYVALVLAAALFIYQQKLLSQRERSAYFTAFLNNNYVGLIIFIGIGLSFIV